jgi:hypothetical protein
LKPVEHKQPFQRANDDLEQLEPLNCVSVAAETVDEFAYNAKHKVMFFRFTKKYLPILLRGMLLLMMLMLHLLLLRISIWQRVLLLLHCSQTCILFSDLLSLECKE